MDYSDRDAFRYKLVEDKYATLVLDDKFYVEARIQDVSFTGVCLEIIFDKKRSLIEIKKGDKCDLKLKADGKRPNPIQGKITRSDRVDNTCWLGIKFAERIETTFLSLIRSNSQSAFELAKVDKGIVQGEALQIKTCASNYFIWTIGCILPLISAILTLSLQGKIDPLPTFCSYFTIFLIYSMSVFSSMEKSRAIYKRESFVAAIDTYLIRGISPPDYRGWINLKYNFAECGSRRDGKACPREQKTGDNIICRHKGEELAKINPYKKVVHSILDSFISLTTVFYTIIYFIILILIAFSLVTYFNLGQYNLSEGYLVLVIVGAWAAGFCLGRNHNIMFILLMLSVLIFFVKPLLSGPISNATAPTILLNISISSVFIFNAFIGFIIGSIGNIWVGQLILLRKKQYSFESQFYMWLQMLENCIFMPDYTVSEYSESSSFKSSVSNFADRIFLGK